MFKLVWPNSLCGLQKAGFQSALGGIYTAALNRFEIFTKAICELGHSSKSFKMALEYQQDVKYTSCVVHF